MLLEQRPEAFASRRIARGLGRGRPRRLGRESGAAVRVARGERMASRLVVAGPGAGHRGGRLPRGAGQAQVAAADGKTSGGAQPSRSRGPLGGGEWSDKQWCVHTSASTTCPITLSGSALETNIFSAAAERDGEPFMVPPHTPVGADLARIEPVGICKRWQFAELLWWGHCRR
jgi:hypothetical protein